MIMVAVFSIFATLSVIAALLWARQRPGMLRIAGADLRQRDRQPTTEHPHIGRRMRALHTGDSEGACMKAAVVSESGGPQLRLAEVAG